MKHFLVTLEEVKNHCIIEHDLDDKLLDIYISAAEEAVANAINRDLISIANEVQQGNRQTIKVAVLTLIASWYENREAVSEGNVIPREVPYSFKFILDLNRNYKGITGFKI